MATYLPYLKETFADPGEILRAEWIDLKGNVFSINHLNPYEIASGDISRAIPSFLIS
jgi:hypothetical protein